MPSEPRHEAHPVSGRDEGLRAALDLVNEQAEDEGLWFHAITAAEAYLQQELRQLHTAVERAALDAVPVQPEPRITGRDVHREWRDGMLAQGRHVAPERMAWETLDPADHELDDRIAARLSAAAATPTHPDGGIDVATLGMAEHRVAAATYRAPKLQRDALANRSAAESWQRHAAKVAAEYDRLRAAAPTTPQEADTNVGDGWAPDEYGGVLPSGGPE